MGEGVNANNPNSYAFGKGATASADNAISMGLNATASRSSSFAINGVASGSNSFAVNGNAVGNYSKAFGVTSNGDYSLTSGSSVSTTVAATYSIAMGYYVEASGQSAVAIGSGKQLGTDVKVEAKGEGSISMGSSTKANAKKSISIGSSTVADGENSVSIGTVSTASGVASLALGNFVTAGSAWSTAIGYNNLSYGDPTVATLTDPLFIVGNGFSGSESNAMLIRKNGNVGIGENYPSLTLDVKRSVSNDFLARFRNTGDAANCHGILVHAGSQTTGGAYLIGFARPNSSGASILIGSVTQNGISNVSYNTASDARIKTNIIETHFGISDLMKVQVRDFEFREDFSGKTNTGFIAQELFDVYPLAVSKPIDEEGLWQVDYGRVTPLIVKAVQDQQYMIESLSNENTQLKSELKELKEEVEKIRLLISGTDSK